MAQVVLDRVTKVYPGDIKAVDNVSLEIRDREFVVLVGPSGCGKSTTLRMVAGLEEITSGTIRIGDRVVNDIPPKDRDIAMVFQNYALYPHMTVYKNMAFGLKLRRVPKAEIDKKVRETAKLLAIENLLDRKPKALSGGQRQRVAVGRAIVRTPKAFLFDEPLSNLDAKLRVEMRGELKRLHRRLATTTLYVTHDQEEAMTLGDRVVVMKDGVVQQAAAPLTIYEQPANRFVAGFVGTPPMNFLAGRLMGENGQLYFRGPSVRLRLPQRLHAGLAGREGQPMVLGIRPEGLSDEADGRFAGEENVLDATVQVTELLGDRMDVVAQTPDDDRIVCRVDARRPLKDGMKVSLHVNMDQVHVFEPGDEGVNVSLTHVGDRASAA
ncbi:MAG: sn-glycerol-3-phosphate ABC transporter ATP-binding protein UgpC [Planctomycetes bacterium]|nr:sn-glycerol-3-phosphate ABC transporter ATP-binding protein UgpC [Planctomycetota bacterium]